MNAEVNSAAWRIKVELANVMPKSFISIPRVQFFNVQNKIDNTSQLLI